MPKKAGVPFEELFNILLSCRNEIIKDKKIPAPSDKIYNKIALGLHCRMSQKAIYNVLRKNNGEIFRRLGGEIQPEAQTFPQIVQVSSDFNINEPEDNEVEDISCDENKINFAIKLSDEMWDKIKPVKSYGIRNDSCKPNIKFRSRNVLPKGVWANFVNDLIYREQRYPCNWVFRTGNEQVYCYGKCCQCGATLICKIGEQYFSDKTQRVLKCEISDYSADFKHDESRKRKLYGVKRKIVAEELSKSSIVGYRQNLANDLMKYGQAEPSILHSAQVYRQAKSEQQQLEKLHRNPVLAVWQAKHSLPYLGIIHDCGLDPFFVHYWTQSQMSLYKTYQKLYTILSLDATGSLIKSVKPEPKPLGFTKSKPIFIYVGVLSTESSRATPVVQMLSQSHDTLAIKFWLQKWYKNFVKPPNEIRTDDSSALVSAAVQTFTAHRSVNEYLLKCYQCLKGDDAAPPAAFIRLDRNHFIKSLVQWKCFINKDVRIKKFYCHSIGLLVDKTSFKEIEYIIRHILISSISRFENAVCTDSLNYLIDFISKGEVSIEDEILNAQICSINSEMERDENNNYDWFGEILHEVEKSLGNCDTKNYKDNLFSLPEILNPLKKICNKLPLWSAVMTPLFNSKIIASTSSYVESYFKELKTLLFKGENKLSPDIFLSKHINFLQGRLKLDCPKELKPNSASDTSEVHQENKLTEPKTPDNSFPEESVFQITPTEEENWKGKNTATPRRSSKSYLDSHKTWDLNKLKKNNVKTVNVLKNGNVCSAVVLGGKKVSFENTCAFDSFVQSILHVYNQSPKYRSIVEGNQSDELNQVLINLSRNAMRKAYTARARILCGLFKEIHLDKNVTRVSCQCNVSFLVENFARILPSISGLSQCSNSSCTLSRQPFNKAFIPINYDIFSLFGICSLEECVNIDDIKNIKKCKTCQIGIITTDITLNDIVFLEIFHIKEINHSVHLLDIPITLKISQKSYSLAAVIEFIPSSIGADAMGHYVTHLCDKGFFQTVDDFSDSVRNATTKTIVPHVLVYHLEF